MHLCKMACSSKTIGRRMNRVKFGGGGYPVVVICRQGTFDLLVFNVIWGDSVILCLNGL